MGYNSNIRAMAAAQRREAREAQRRLRELEKQAKEEAKLSALEQARLEVETFEKRIEVLLSIHTEQGPNWDWRAVAAALPPCNPQRLTRNQYKARISGLVDQLETAVAQDDHEFQDALSRHAAEMQEWQRMRELARQILDGNARAYTEALKEFSGLAEISDLGSLLHFTVSGPSVIECHLTVNGRKAIPAEQKSLTATGKLSVKQMPKARFHEIYQDYVCGCLLRTAREVFALLEVESLLITASVPPDRTAGRRSAAIPVLSVAISKAEISQFDFQNLDPSDTIETLPHRGNFKASRKTGDFEPIVPLTPADLPPPSVTTRDFADLLSNMQQLRSSIRNEIDRLPATEPPPGDPQNLNP